MTSEEQIIMSGIWSILDQFAGEFEAQPYRYWQEIDVQVAVTSRIDQFLRAQGLDVLRGNYPGAMEGFAGRQEWSRVSCEPSILMKWEGNEITVKPDIVVWRQLEDEN